MPIALVVLAGCGGPGYTEADFDLVGTWAVVEDESASGTTLEFADDGTWALLDPGDRCGAPPFQSWFCLGPGTWDLAPDPVLAREDATLTIVQKRYAEDRLAFEAWFDGDPDHFCWKMSFAGRECLVRL